MNAPIGLHRELGFEAERDGSHSRITLERPACVALLEVSATYEGTAAWHVRGYGPVLGPFSAAYPLRTWETRCLEAGTHALPLQSVGHSRIAPPTCLREDRPSMDGCHPPGYESRPSRRDFLAGPRDPATAYILLASDLPIDPYAVAYAMSVRLLESEYQQETLAGALFNGEQAVVARLVEELVADVPGSPLWAGIVRMREPG